MILGEELKCSVNSHAITYMSKCYYHNWNYRCDDFVCSELHQGQVTSRAGGLRGGKALS